ncbi:GD19900 [Drosophila simulans]|uniref:GD19900 n=1 Tax=Drosophila simulans TaxID=7240 RepID=B4QYY5_DROSI|nr:GD19900 [Drosophila simulans]
MDGGAGRERECEREGQTRKERSHGCCPYASLLFDNCATLNHSIRVQDQAQNQTRSQLESSASLRLGPFSVPVGRRRVCVWRSPWEIFSHAAATDNSPQSLRFRSSKLQQEPKTGAYRLGYAINNWRSKARVPFSWMEDFKNQVPDTFRDTSSALFPVPGPRPPAIPANKSTCAGNNKSGPPKVIDEVARRIYDVKL